MSMSMWCGSFLIRGVLYASAKLVDGAIEQLRSVVRYRKQPRRYIWQFVCAIVKVLLNLAGEEFSVPMLITARITGSLVLAWKRPMWAHPRCVFAHWCKCGNADHHVTTTSETKGWFTSEKKIFRLVSWRSLRSFISNSNISAGTTLCIIHFFHICDVLFSNANWGKKSMVILFAAAMRL